MSYEARKLLRESPQALNMLYNQGDIQGDFGLQFPARDVKETDRKPITNDGDVRRY